MNPKNKSNSGKYIEYLLKSISKCEQTAMETQNGLEQNGSGLAEHTKHWFQQLRDCIERDQPISWVVRINVYEDRNQTIERIKYRYDPGKPYYEMASIVIYQSGFNDTQFCDE